MDCKEPENGPKNDFKKIESADETRKKAKKDKKRSIEKAEKEENEGEAEGKVDEDSSKGETLKELAKLEGKKDTENMDRKDLAKELKKETLSNSIKTGETWGKSKEERVNIEKRDKKLAKKWTEQQYWRSILIFDVSSMYINALYTVSILFKTI